jgi:hypothetical protein
MHVCVCKKSHEISLSYFTLLCTESGLHMNSSSDSDPSLNFVKQPTDYVMLDTGNPIVMESKILLNLRATHI